MPQGRRRSSGGAIRKRPPNAHEEKAPQARQGLRCQWCQGGIEAPTRGLSDLGYGPASHALGNPLGTPVSWVPGVYSVASLFPFPHAGERSPLGSVRFAAHRRSSHRIRSSRRRGATTLMPSGAGWQVPSRSPIGQMTRSTDPASCASGPSRQTMPTTRRGLGPHRSFALTAETRIRRR